MGGVHECMCVCVHECKKKFPFQQRYVLYTLVFSFLINKAGDAAKTDEKEKPKKQINEKQGEFIVKVTVVDIAAEKEAAAKKEKIAAAKAALYKDAADKAAAEKAAADKEAAAKAVADKEAADKAAAQAATDKEAADKAKDKPIGKYFGVMLTVSRGSTGGPA